MSRSGIRHLVIVLGDQLDRDLSALDDFDIDADRVFMCEARHEAEYVPQHRQRLVLFFSAMRHFRDRLIERGYPVLYRTLDDPENTGRLDSELARCIDACSPRRIVLTRAGDFRVLEAIRETADRAGIELEVRGDRHFFDSVSGFADYAGARKQLLLENYYRRLRKRFDILIADGKPAGGRWNFDADNRQALTTGACAEMVEPLRFDPDATTREVMRLVVKEFPDSPGDIDAFKHPVSGEDAERALDDFVAHRLADFGRYQDAMAEGQPYLYHSLLSTSLNLHLMDPRSAIEAAVSAYENGVAPINAVEGFVRQVLGWREYIRGIYWLKMPGYAEENFLEAELPMPAFMWDAQTDMQCVRQSVGQLVDTGYTHHIQRLMVLGLLAMLLGVRPIEVHRWHISMYVDAIDWVSLPNVLGMSQFADGGLVGTKPYCASGNYINRMSNYCQSCRYRPDRAEGEAACPFTTLYWDFLARHRDRLEGNRRMLFQYRNLARKSNKDVKAIRHQADDLKQTLTAKSYL